MTKIVLIVLFVIATGLTVFYFFNKPANVGNDIMILNETNFDTTIAEGVTIVDFYADWCGPCRMLSPVMDELAKELEGVTVGKVNVDESQNIAAKFGISAIPAVILFKDGTEMKRFVGIQPKATFVTEAKKLTE